jgi:preprotein translocase subunit YajC
VPVGTDPEKEGGTMILAQEAATGGSPLGLILPLVLFVGIFYFLILRPQRQRMKQQQDLMANIGLGDEVRTIGGVLGRIVSMDDENVVLEVEEGRIKFSRRAIASKTTPPEPPTTPPEDI